MRTPYEVQTADRATRVGESIGAGGAARRQQLSAISTGYVLRSQYAVRSDVSTQYPATQYALWRRENRVDLGGSSLGVGLAELDEAT